MFIAVLIFCCIISVEYLLHVQCCKVAKLQHLTVAEYSACPFSSDSIPVLSYFIAVLIICYVSTVKYMLHMQCCNVT